MAGFPLSLDRVLQSLHRLRNPVWGIDSVDLEQDGVYPPGSFPELSQQAQFVSTRQQYVVTGLMR